MKTNFYEQCAHKSLNSVYQNKSISLKRCLHGAVNNEAKPIKSYNNLGLVANKNKFLKDNRKKAGIYM